MPIQNNIPNMGNQLPADFLKFIALKQAVNTFDEAVEKIKSKKPVLGEPVVVPFKNGADVELAFGIGSLDPDNPLIVTSDARFKVEDAESEGGYKYESLLDIIDNIVHTAIEEKSNDEIAQLVIESDTFKTGVTEKISELWTESMRWQPLPVIPSE